MNVSVVIPTLNEETRLRELIARLRITAGRAKVEVVVADGGSRDETVAAARDAADKTVCAPRGRAAQMHAGASVATGEILLFLHADTKLPDRWLQSLLDAWSARPRPGATAFTLGFDRQEGVYPLIAALGNARTRLTGVPHGDQAIACRREDYVRVGGFPLVPIMEEYELLPKLAVLGPVLILPEAVATSARRYERNGPLRNALKNTLMIALYKAGASHERLARMYR